MARLHLLAFGANASCNLAFEGAGRRDELYFAASEDCYFGHSNRSVVVTRHNAFNRTLKLFVQALH